MNMAVDLWPQPTVMYTLPRENSGTRAARQGKEQDMKEFEKDYAAFEGIKADYDRAEAAKDEAGQEKARADYRAWADGIEAKGRDYADTFRIYKDSRDNGNPRLDISEPHHVRNIPELVKNLRDHGVTEFTYSSTWSSAIEASWEFLRNGCRLAGMTEVFTHCTKIFSDEHETVPAYLFRIE